MNLIKITLNSGETKEVKKGLTYYEISKIFGFKEALAIKAKNDIISLTEIANEDITLSFIDVTDLYGGDIYKSGLKLVFQVALKRAFPEAEVYYEHSVPRGMLAEINYNKSLTQDDIFKIKSIMAQIIIEDTLIKKFNVRKKEAIAFYNKNKEFEKADNISNISDKVITLYELDGTYNYFYSDMPYSTGVMSQYDIVYLGKNKLVFLIPNGKTNGKVPEYVHYDNIINSFLESKSWLALLNMPYVTNLNLTVGNGKIKKFINSSEIMFNQNISKVVEEITLNKNIKFVMIAGPSSSGKTTTTKRLVDYLSTKGYDPIAISTDDYFLNRNEMVKKENGEYDFECLEAIDLNYFNQDLKKLLSGEVINLPQYNFITGKKQMTTKSIKLKEKSIILIEGLHSLNDNLIFDVDNKEKYKIYLSPFIPLSVDRHNYISTIDLRLLRRIVRDNRTRGYGVATTIHNWQTVRKGEEKNIFPFIHQADTIINTALAYEVGVLKIYIEPLLLTVGIDSAYFMEARRLLSFLKQFFPIPGEFVNKDSILREFIGGNDD